MGRASRLLPCAALAVAGCLGAGEPAPPEIVIHVMDDAPATLVAFVEEGTAGEALCKTRLLPVAGGPHERRLPIDPASRQVRMVLARRGCASVPYSLRADESGRFDEPRFDCEPAAARPVVLEVVDDEGAPVRGGYYAAAYNAFPFPRGDCRTGVMVWHPNLEFAYGRLDEGGRAELRIERYPAGDPMLDAELVIRVSRDPGMAVDFDLRGFGVRVGELPDGKLRIVATRTAMLQWEGAPDGAATLANFAPECAKLACGLALKAKDAGGGTTRGGHSIRTSVTWFSFSGSRNDHVLIDPGDYRAELVVPGEGRRPERTLRPLGTVRVRAGTRVILRPDAKTGIRREEGPLPVELLAKHPAEIVW